VEILIGIVGLVITVLLWLFPPEPFRTKRLSDKGVTSAWQDAILFIETSEQVPSPEVVKYGLRTCAALGILQRLSGILFGRPGGKVSFEKHKEYDKALLQVVAEEEGLEKICQESREMKNEKIVSLWKR